MHGEGLEWWLNGYDTCCMSLRTCIQNPSTHIKSQACLHTSVTSALDGEKKQRWRIAGAC